MAHNDCKDFSLKLEKTYHGNMAMRLYELNSSVASDKYKRFKISKMLCSKTGFEPYCRGNISHIGLICIINEDYSSYILSETGACMMRKKVSANNPI